MDRGKSEHSKHSSYLLIKQRMKIIRDTHNRTAEITRYGEPQASWGAAKVNSGPCAVSRGFGGGGAGWGTGGREWLASSSYLGCILGRNVTQVASPARTRPRWVWKVVSEETL